MVKTDVAVRELSVLPDKSESTYDELLRLVKIQKIKFRQAGLLFAGFCNQSVALDEKPTRCFIRRSDL